MKMFTLFSEKEERRKIGKNKEEKEWKEQATDVAVMDNNIVTFYTTFQLMEVRSTMPLDDSDYIIIIIS